MTRPAIPRTAEFEARQLCLDFGAAFLALGRGFLATLTRCTRALRKSYGLMHPKPTDNRKSKQLVILLDSLAQIPFRWEIPSFMDTLRPNTP